MLKYRRTAAALAVVGGLFLAPGTSALAADDKTDALKTQVDRIETQLTTMGAQLKTLTEAINAKNDQSIMAQLEALKVKLKSIEEQLTTLRTRTSSSSLRPAPSIPANPIIDAPKFGRGIVRIVNDYPVPISMVINGTSYPVASLKAVDVPVPVGDFEYQLVQSGAAPTRSKIKDNETVTLRIK